MKGKLGEAIHICKWFPNLACETSNMAKVNVVYGEFLLRGTLKFNLFFSEDKISRNRKDGELRRERRMWINTAPQQGNELLIVYFSVSTVVVCRSCKKLLSRTKTICFFRNPSLILYSHQLPRCLQKNNASKVSLK